MGNQCKMMAYKCLSVETKVTNQPAFRSKIPLNLMKRPRYASKNMSSKKKKEVKSCLISVMRVFLQLKRN